LKKTRQEINISEWLVNQRHTKTKHIFGKYVCRHHLYSLYWIL